MSLSERERDGVTVDVCPECRGVWLDRGELEKLIARATRDIDELERRPPRRVDDDDDDDPRGGYPGDERRGHQQRRRKRGWLDAFDIFD